jgi:glutamyl/glutaminyl-tRNA synthetase
MGLRWWVRFEDIDRPRVIPGAREQQLEDLERLGLRPDDIEVQSANHELHHRAFLDLVRSGAVFPCTCSRREVEQELASAASAPNHPASAGSVYPGTCQRRGAEATLHEAGRTAPARALAWRLSGNPVVVARTTRTHPLDVAGFEPAYHLACAIDDSREDPTHRLLVRAWDLADATPVQREIRRAWRESRGLTCGTPPSVFHTSLITTDAGSRLEKRTRGITLPELEAHGLPPASLLLLFSKSFDLQAALQGLARPDSGERRRELPLSNLLEGLRLESE